MSSPRRSPTAREKSARGVAGALPAARGHQPLVPRFRDCCRHPDAPQRLGAPLTERVESPLRPTQTPYPARNLARRPGRSIGWKPVPPAPRHVRDVTPAPPPDPRDSRDPARQPKGPHRTRHTMKRVQVAGGLLMLAALVGAAPYPGQEWRPPSRADAADARLERPGGRVAGIVGSWFNGWACRSPACVPRATAAAPSALRALTAEMRPVGAVERPQRRRPRRHGGGLPQRRARFRLVDADYDGTANSFRSYDTRAPWPAKSATDAAAPRPRGAARRGPRPTETCSRRTMPRRGPWRRRRPLKVRPGQPAPAPLRRRGSSPPATTASRPLPPDANSAPTPPCAPASTRWASPRTAPSPHDPADDSDAWDEPGWCVPGEVRDLVVTLAPSSARTRSSGSTPRAR